MLWIFIGILIGIAVGTVQFFLLYRFVTSVTGGKPGIKTLIFALTQFLFPFAVLVAIAFLLPDSLLWVGIGAAVSLISCAVIKFFIVSKTSSKQSGKQKKQTNSKPQKKKNAKSGSKK